MILRRLLLAAALALLATGCGALRFQRAWSSFERSAKGADELGVEGRWRGEWRSERDGHSGGLRCLMTACDEERYRAWFYSTYAGILFFQYETELRVTAREPGLVRFAGEQDLGAAAGGVYRYEGSVEGERFTATYRAENGDHGVFELRRVE